MEDVNNTDPRPKERFTWIKEAREVEPLLLEPPVLTNETDLKSAETTSGLEKYGGIWGDREVRHLLSRTMFGVKKENLVHFKQLTMDEAVNQLITSSPLPAPPVNDYEGYKGAHDPHVGFGDSWLQAPHGGSDESLRVVSLKAWLMRNIINQEATIHEKMVLFWSNLLVTKVWDVYIAKASYRYFEMIYNNALGNYKTFIKALTLDPSMLIFLNGKSNTKEAPDENYGRELQELFCVGKGPDSKYTEGDVQNAARVLTGYRITWEPYVSEGDFASYFDHFKHFKGDKKFSSFYNNTTIEGKLGGQGREELDDMLDMIFANEETAKYICRRIYSFFVSNLITESIEQKIIAPLAEIFRSNNYEITPVLLTLFKSEHFYDVQNRGVLIKSPVDHLLGLWRTFNLDKLDEDDLIANYEKHLTMLWHMSSMGMEIGDPPNVAGWTPYYQAPQYDKAWITTTTITKRALTTDSLLYWGFWIASGRTIKADLIEFAQTLDEPSDPNLLLKEAALLFLGIEISDEAMNELKSVLLSGQQSDYYWTAAWNDYMANSGNSTKRLIVENRLKWTFQRMLQLGEYHLM